MRAAALVLALSAACATSRGALDDPRGFPRLDHTWGPADFQQSGAEVDRLSGSDVASLPRRGNPVFSRMVDLTIGDDVADASQPLSTRAALTTGYMGGMGRVLKAYSRAGPSFLPETRELLIAFFVNGCDMIQLISRANALPDSELANPQGVHEAYAGIRSGLQRLITGIVGILHPREGVQEADRVRYAALVARHLPHLMPLLTEAERQGVHRQIDGFIAREPNPSVRERLSAVR